MRLLIDECLSVKLADEATRRGVPADHVQRIGRGGQPDRALVRFILDNDYTFVTNNRLDFLRLHGKEAVHAGLVVIVPSVARDEQIVLLHAVLDYLTINPDLVNHVLEIRRDGTIDVRPLSAP